MSKAKVLLFMVRGRDCHHIVSHAFKRLTEQHGLEFDYSYIDSEADAKKAAGERFDLIIIDLDPGLVNEIEAFYDALSPDQQAKVLGWGHGLPRDNGDEFPPNRIWLPRELTATWVHRIREILAS